MYLDRPMTADSVMFRGICPTKYNYDDIMSLKIDKSALDIPRKCIKHAANHNIRGIKYGFESIFITSNISGKL